MLSHRTRSWHLGVKKKTILQDTYKYEVVQARVNNHAVYMPGCQESGSDSIGDVSGESPHSASTWTKLNDGTTLSEVNNTEL